MTPKNALLLVMILLSIILMAAPVAAVVSIDTSTDYKGGEKGNTQAVEMTYTLSPEDHDVSDVRITVRGTDNSFVDFESFERTINPGDADVKINTVSDGVFEIENLEVNQEITLLFKAYPKDIQQRKLDMATVHVEYVQQGQSLEETTTITADLSDSPWFQLQEAKEDGNDGNDSVALLFGLLLGLIAGAAAGGGAYYFLS